MPVVSLMHTHGLHLPNPLFLKPSKSDLPLPEFLSQVPWSTPTWYPIYTLALQIDLHKEIFQPLMGPLTELALGPSHNVHTLVLVPANKAPWWARVLDFP